MARKYKTNKISTKWEKMSDKDFLASAQRAATRHQNKKNRLNKK